jgi:hypothetical protein
VTTHGVHDACACDARGAAHQSHGVGARVYPPSPDAEQRHSVLVNLMLCAGPLGLWSRCGIGPAVYGCTAEAAHKLGAMGGGVRSRVGLL